MNNQILKLQLLALAFLGSIKLMAQKGLDINVDLDGKDTPAIFEKPVFWIGVAIVVIIIAFILKKK